MSPSLFATLLVLRTRNSLLKAAQDERGDIPAWVMITVMTAGIVVALWAVAKDSLKTMLTDALDSVKA